MHSSSMLSKRINVVPHQYTWMTHNLSAEQQSPYISRLGQRVFLVFCMPVLVGGCYKMSSVMPFSFNVVELYAVTINEKLWARTREVCRALTYEKAARQIVRHQCTRENFQHGHQLVVLSTVSTTINWPRNLQKLYLYINEEGMNKLFFPVNSPRQKKKNIRRYCWNVVFPYVWQQLTKKMKKDYQQAIKEKDAALAHRDN